MSQFSEWILSAVASFENAKSLRANVDDEREPFKSKYVAVDIYRNLLKDLDSMDALAVDNGNNVRYWLLLFALNFESGITHSDTEDLRSAELCFQKCIDIFNNNLKISLIIEKFNSSDEENTLVEQKQSSLSPETDSMLTLIKILLYNQLGFLKCMRMNTKSSIVFLKEAENLYHQWSKNDSQPYVLNIEDLFKLDSNLITFKQIEESCNTKTVDKTEIEKAYIMSVYFLAQAFEQTGDYPESAKYCHMTLKLQYPFLSCENPVMDHIEWSLNAGTLSQYFASNDQYDVARHFICCARFVLLQTDSEKIEKENERFKKAEADLYRIEVKYGLMLLDESFILRQEGKIDNFPQNEYQFKPYLLNEAKLSEMEQQMPSFPAKTYDDAKVVFKFALNAIDSAKKFFTIDERCSDYIDCIFDHSQIYASIISYIPEIESRCKIVKRRIDLLESIDKQINSQYYLQHCRKIAYELGTIYSEQVSLKQLQHQKISNEECIEQSQFEERSMQVLKKFNMLISKSILNYQKFLHTFDYLNTKKRKFSEYSIANIELYKLPTRIDDENYIKPILTAYLSIGQLYTKLFTEPKQQRLNWIKCEDYYNELKCYCTRNDDHRRQYFEDYYQQLEEMLILIPGKVQQISANID